MKRFLLLGSLLLSAALAACGGGSSPVSAPTLAPTQSPTKAPTYTVSIHWQPVGNEHGLSSALRTAQSEVRMMDAGTGNVVVQSADSGFGKDSGGVIDLDNGSAALVTAQASPAPNPMPTVAFSTTATAVTLSPTPTPAPGATAQPTPAIGVVPNTPATAQTGTISANVGGVTATNSLVLLRSYAIALWASASMESTAESTLGEYAAYTVDANCNLVGQTTPNGADIYLSWANGPAPFNSNEGEATLHIPGGGIALIHGDDPTTLTASQWQNTTTAFGLNTVFGTMGDDTILFKAANGKIVYLGGAVSVSPGNGTAEADVSGAVGCL